MTCFLNGPIHPNSEYTRFHSPDTLYLTFVVDPRHCSGFARALTAPIDSRSECLSAHRAFAYLLGAPNNSRTLDAPTFSVNFPLAFSIRFQFGHKS